MSQPTAAPADDAAPHVLGDVLLEFARLDALHGAQDRRNGTSHHDYGEQARQAAFSARRARTKGKLTWRHILAEQYWAVLAHNGNATLRDRLIQLAAHALLWAAALDRRAQERGALVHGAAAPPPSGAPSPAPEHPHPRTDMP